MDYELEHGKGESLLMDLLRLGISIAIILPFVNN